MLLKACPKCGIDHEKPGTYCSRSCANGRPGKRSDDFRKRMADLAYAVMARKNFVPAHKLRPYRPCSVCGVLFNSPYRSCSPTCGYVLAKNKQDRKPMGGFRAGSGSSHKGWYKGVFCASTYELAWVIYHLDHDTAFERCRLVFEYAEGRKYHPDFFIEPGRVIEIKGYVTEITHVKAQAVRDQGYSFELVTKQELLPMFAYIERAYGVKPHQLHKMLTKRGTPTETRTPFSRLKFCDPNP